MTWVKYLLLLEGTYSHMRSDHMICLTVLWHLNSFKQLYWWTKPETSSHSYQICPPSELMQTHAKPCDNRKHVHNNLWESHLVTRPVTNHAQTSHTFAHRPFWDPWLNAQPPCTDVPHFLRTDLSHAHGPFETMIECTATNHMIFSWCIYTSFHGNLLPLAWIWVVIPHSLIQASLDTGDWGDSL